MAEILKIDFDHPDPALKNALDMLISGGIVSFPTETFYGLGVNALDEKAVNKVFRVKERDINKPLLIFIASKDRLSDLATSVNTTAKKLIDCFWPGPLTLVFEASSKVPEVLTGNTGKIGVRVSGSSFVRQLCELSEFPITGSSANISNNPEPASAVEVMEALGDKIDLLLDGGKATGTQSSTVLDVCNTLPKLLREGIIGKDAIESVLGTQLK
tara:strand:- start:1289 stop:1930 length:642 start_codon:yes stop_codon:yes gene_type:complete